MPLWVAAVLFLLCVAGAVFSFRAYSRGGAKIFLAAGVTLSLLCVVALLYVAAVVLLVSAVK